MKKMFLYLGIVLLIAVPEIQIEAAKASCRFLDIDFPEFARSWRTGKMWDNEYLVHFLSDQAAGSVRLLVGNERVVCASFQNLPAGKKLHGLLLKLGMQDRVEPADWQNFLDALDSLTCEAIYKNGDTSTCPNGRMINFIKGARKAALAATTYNPGYVKINPVEGVVPDSQGVCTDVIIRGLRDAGIDLQDLVYKDIKKHPERYQSVRKGNSPPDRNIDHRRVTNLMVYFSGDSAQFATLEPPDREWLPGDIIAWNLMGGKGFVPHIGVVSDRKGSSGVYLVIHHLPEQGREDDMLRGWKIIGHFRPLLGD